MNDKGSGAGKGLTIGIVGTGAENMRALGAMGTPQPKRKLDDVEHGPALIGPHGRAWLCDVPALRKRFTAEEVANDTTVTCWAIEAAYAHPIWHSYGIILVSLRPRVSDLPTRMYVTGATHEFWLFALDPDQPREPAIKGERSLYELSLHPLNFAAQVVVDGDEAAATLIRGAVIDVIGGTLNPDTDFTMAWANRFGGGMLRK